MIPDEVHPLVRIADALERIAAHAEKSANPPMKIYPEEFDLRNFYGTMKTE